MGFFELLLVIPFFLIGIFGTIVWIWMLIDCALHEPSQGNDKIVWVMIILFTHFVGALIYLIVRRPKRIAEGGQ